MSHVWMPLKPRHLDDDFHRRYYRSFTWALFFHLVGWNGLDGDKVLRLSILKQKNKTGSYTHLYILTLADTYTHVSAASLTNLSLIWLSVLRQLNELLGEHAAPVAQDVALKLGVSIGEQKLHYDGISCGIDADFHVLASHWGGRRGHCSTFE